MFSLQSKLLSSALLAGLLSVAPMAQANSVLGFHGVNLQAELGNGLYITVYDRHRPNRHHRPLRRPPPRGYWYGGRWYSGYWYGDRWYGGYRHDGRGRGGHGGHGHGGHGGHRHGGHRY